MADTAPTDTTSTTALSDWGGLAPFVQAAFSLNASKQADNSALMKAAQQGKLQSPHNKTMQLTTPGGMGQGPMEMPQGGPVQNTIPAPLQAGVNGPLTMPQSTPQTPLTQSTGTTPTGVPTQINHFITGTPNALGSRSIGLG